jgi:UDP-2,4-diacetamido-2,4,6-trideoxy-beta-L-altropyranose hydrolase
VLPLVENLPVADRVVLVADAGREAGLGHISRSSAVAIALRCRGIETSCFADGVDEAFQRDGIAWKPIGDETLPVSGADILVVDSYRRTTEELAAAARKTRMVVMHDFGVVPDGAALVVSAAAHDPDDEGKRLTGLAYSCLRPAFWGLPARTLEPSVDRILVTTGSGQFAEIAVKIAQTLAQAIPGARVTLVRGPHASAGVPAGVEILESPDSLLAPLLAADVVVTAGGQTMLEAAAAGTPSVALLLVENQRRQAEHLAGVGAARVVDPPEVTRVSATVEELLRNPDARHALSAAGQRAVDGYGAHRVAFHIERLARGRA